MAVPAGPNTGLLREIFSFLNFPEAKLKPDSPIYYTVPTTLSIDELMNPTEEVLYNLIKNQHLFGKPFRNLPSARELDSKYFTDSGAITASCIIEVEQGPLSVNKILKIYPGKFYVNQKYGQYRNEDIDDPLFDVHCRECEKFEKKVTAGIPVSLPKKEIHHSISK